MDAVSAAYNNKSTIYLSLVQYVLSMATNVHVPFCPHMYGVEEHKPTQMNYLEKTKPNDF